MQISSQDEGDLLRRELHPKEGPSSCIGALPIGERFVLWALRQWRCELEECEHHAALPTEGSILRRGFQTAGLVESLPAFATAMEALLLDIRHVMEIHPPPNARVSRDEAVLIALCGLAQGRFEEPLRASLKVLLGEAASQVAAARLKTFTTALGDAGLELGLPPGSAGRWLN